MLFLKLVKSAHKSCGVSCINTIRWHIVRHHRSSTNNHIIPNACIAENDTICSNKHIASYPDNSYFCMCTSLDGTSIMRKNPHITRQRHIIPNRNQPRPIRINRITAVILEILSCCKTVSKTIVHCGFLRSRSHPAGNSLQHIGNRHISTSHQVIGRSSTNRESDTS